MISNFDKNTAFSYMKTYFPSENIQVFVAPNAPTWELVGTGPVGGRKRSGEGRFDYCRAGMRATWLNRSLQSQFFLVPCLSLGGVWFQLGLKTIMGI